MANSDAAAERERRLRALAADIYTTFTTPAGARVMADWDKSIGLRPSYFPGDPYATAYREGERALWLKVKRFMDLGEMVTQGVEINMTRVITDNDEETE